METSDVVYRDAERRREGGGEEEREEGGIAVASVDGSFREEGRHVCGDVVFEADESRGGQSWAWDGKAEGEVGRVLRRGGERGE